MQENQLQRSVLSRLKLYAPFTMQPVVGLGDRITMKDADGDNASTVPRYIDSKHGPVSHTRDHTVSRYTPVITARASLAGFTFRF